jgi:hypothetical protein
MVLTVYTHDYRCKTPDQQLEIDDCLRRNLHHPGISKVVLFKESDAPPLPEATVPLEMVESDARITNAECFRWVKRQGTGIGLLLNADIYLDEGQMQLTATFDSPENFLAHTRYNPGHASVYLNDYTHWSQDVWGALANAEQPGSLLYTSGFPTGIRGYENHPISDESNSMHLKASTARDCDKICDRLYGGASYVHPSLSPGEDAELELTLWTRSKQQRSQIAAMAPTTTCKNPSFANILLVRDIYTQKHSRYNHWAN